MNFEFDDSEQAIRETIRAYLAETSTPASLRRLIQSDEGFDATVWQTLASELGLVGLLIPEVHGGSGLGFVELAAVLHEMGRALYCGPYFSSAVLVPIALRELGDEPGRRQLLPGIANGSRRATLAVGEDAHTPAPDRIQTRAHRDGHLHRLTGRKRFVIDADSAHSILVVARSEEQSSLYRLFGVESDAAGLERTSLATLDPTRRQADLRFSNTPATSLGPALPWDRVARVLALSAIALAAEQAGGAERTLDDSLRYARERIQFGRPIGAFQAIKHKCADMLIASESAKAAALFAAWTASQDLRSVETVASIAQATCSDAYLKNAGENFQIHGGVAFTWEYDAHFHIKRARSSWALFGSPKEHRELTATAMGLR